LEEAGKFMAPEKFNFSGAFFRLIPLVLPVLFLMGERENSPLPKSLPMKRGKDIGRHQVPTGFAAGWDVPEKKNWLLSWRDVRE